MNQTPTLPDVAMLLDQMTESLREPLAGSDGETYIIGVHTGGAWIAHALHDRLGISQPVGTLDITYYRDDLATGKLHHQIRPSRLPWNIDNKQVLLVDDVLHTGRTVRAALNEIFDFGRPAQVLLAVLIDRGGHELPIAADVVGARYDDLPPHQRIHLSGPTPLILNLITAEETSQ